MAAVSKRRHTIVAWLIPLCFSVSVTRAQTPPDAPVAPLPSSSPDRSQEQLLEDRIKAIESRYEEMDRRHAESFKALSQKYEALKRDVNAKPATVPVPVPVPVQDANSPKTPEGGAGAEDNALDISRRKAASGPASKSAAKRIPLKASFGPGFDLRSDDDEFQFQFRYLSQVDYRQYTQPNMNPVVSGFSFPRQRLFFSGRVTKPIEYYVTLNRAYGTLDIFDAFINYHYDDRLMMKVGRFKTPFSYEFYAMSAPDFMLTERSLFASNFGPNRQLGMMFWGQLFDKKLDYAFGAFNGNRLSFQDNNEDKSFIAYMNARPFGGDGPEALQNLNLGGSVDVSNDSGTPLPNVLRTSIAASNASDATNIAPPFLAFNKNVVESGYREFWGLHAAYFYKHLSLMAEWEGGFVTYSPSTAFHRVKVPVESYYAAFGYLLTGETLERRGPIKPLKPFDLRHGKMGPGAWEMVGRFSQLDLGQNVFTGGLADPNLWTSSLYMTDFGFNWYLNDYAKIYLDWEHAVFGNAVQDRPGGSLKTSNLFWLRFQVFF